MNKYLLKYHVSEGSGEKIIEAEDTIEAMDRLWQYLGKSDHEERPFRRARIELIGTEEQLKIEF